MNSQRYGINTPGRRLSFLRLRGIEMPGLFSEKYSKTGGDKNVRTMFCRVVIADIDHSFIPRIERIEILSSATRWEILGLHHRGMSWLCGEWGITRTIGRGRCVDDNRFQNMLCEHHQKANLDRPATPMVHDWHPGSRSWGYEHSEPHHLIML